MTLPFEDRTDAGKQLARVLSDYTENAVAVGLPRGGVVLAYEVARALKIPLDIVCPRKIGAPSNPEYAIGAVTETGEGIITAPYDVPEKYIKEKMAEEIAEAERRLKLYRGSKPPREFQGKIILLIDDGLATGSTMLAAIRSVRKSNPEKIVVAVPVAPYDTLSKIEEEANEVICLHPRRDFMAVGQFYNKFTETSDGEVISLMKLL